MQKKNAQADPMLIICEYSTLLEGGERSVVALMRARPRSSQRSTAGNTGRRPVSVVPTHEYLARLARREAQRQSCRQGDAHGPLEPGKEARWGLGALQLLRVALADNSSFDKGVRE